MEFALAMLLVGKYSLVITRARKDAKEAKEQKQKQAEEPKANAGRANNHSDRP